MSASKSTTRRNVWLEASPPDRRGGLERHLLHVVDVGLAAVIFGTPLLIGGRHPLGQLALVSLCSLIALAWFVHQSVINNGRWIRSNAVWVGVLAVAFTLLQIVSLPGEWIETLSPRLSMLLPVWSEDAGVGVRLGTWNTLSLAPHETRQSLAMLVAYVLLFVTASQRLETDKDIQRVIKWIGLSVLLAAGFGILQYLTANGKYFWFYEYPYCSTIGDVKGSFTNRNHFAHFLVLGLGPMIAYLLIRYSGNRAESSYSRFPMVFGPVLCGLATILVFAVVLFSRSRGGALGLLVASIILSLIYLRYRLVKSSDLALLLCGGMVLVIALLSCYGFEHVAERLDDFASGSLEELDAASGRRKIWNANLLAIQDGWKTGSGTGSHRYIYPAYMGQPSAREYTHAESSPLQIVTENGLPGAVLLASSLIFCLVWSCKALSTAATREQRLLAGACVASLTAGVVHSLVDFVWYVPACMAVTILLAACTFRLSQRADAREPVQRHAWQLPRPVWICLSMIVGLGGSWSCYELVAPARSSLDWDRYQLSAVAHKKVHRDAMYAADDRKQDLKRTEDELTHYMVKTLNSVVTVNPSHERAHLKLATNYLRLFDLRQQNSLNRMTVAQIREAAIASRFSNSQELKEWLTRALGEQHHLLYHALYHTRQAMQLNPLLGESYAMLANLCFLEGCDAKAVEACYQQALAVSPYDSDVAFAIGLHKFSAGRPTEALSYWKTLFQTNTHQQREVVRLLAGRLPASIFLETLQPTFLAFEYVWPAYQQAGTDQDWRAMEQYVARLIQQTSKTDHAKTLAREWTLRAHILMKLEEYDAALRSYQHAVHLQPNEFSLRYESAVLLMQTGRANDAQEQLRWCQARRPDHPGVDRLLKQLSRHQLTQRQAKTVISSNM